MVEAKVVMNLVYNYMTWCLWRWFFDSSKCYSTTTDRSIWSSYCKWYWLGTIRTNGEYNKLLLFVLTIILGSSKYFLLCRFIDGVKKLVVTLMWNFLWKSPKPVLQLSIARIHSGKLSNMQSMKCMWLFRLKLQNL